MKFRLRTSPSTRQIEKSISILKRAPFEEIQRMGYHFQVNDFYSPLNDLNFLRNNEDLWKDQEIPREIDWNKEAQLQIARNVGTFVDELRDIPEFPTLNPLGFGWANNFWNNADALVQYGLLRARPPKRVVEIGCGWSSLLLSRAIRVNGVDCQVNLVEPYPNREIFAALPKHWVHHECILQRAKFNIFEELEEGDICFYDGSHCVKTGSDVAWFFFDVLPTLAPGVLIHLHDIFLPDSYPEAWIFERGQTWNEQELLRAFLMYNKQFEILIANRYLWREEPELLDSLYKKVQPAHGCSFWMKKLGPLSQ